MIEVVKFVIQISKAVVGEKRQLLKRLPKFMYDEEKDLEVISISTFFHPNFVPFVHNEFVEVEKKNEKKK